MLLASIALLLAYLYATYKGISYFVKERRLNPPRKMIVLNIILACVMYLIVFILNQVSNDYRYAWQGIGLINSLTYIHIINMLKDNSVCTSKEPCPWKR